MLKMLQVKCREELSRTRARVAACHIKAQVARCFEAFISNVVTGRGIIKNVTTS